MRIDTIKRPSVGDWRRGLSLSLGSGASQRMRDLRGCVEGTIRERYSEEGVGIQVVSVSRVEA
jgi:hypothetical protein